jgi:hypothetical protein
MRNPPGARGPDNAEAVAYMVSTADFVYVDEVCFPPRPRAAPRGWMDPGGPAGAGGSATALQSRTETRLRAPKVPCGAYGASWAALLRAMVSPWPRCAGPRAAALCF